MQNEPCRHERTKPVKLFDCSRHGEHDFEIQFFKCLDCGEQTEAKVRQIVPLPAGMPS
jgi:hypothetical protein